MNLKDNVMLSLIQYPTMFKNVVSVYDHMFAVIGNGYQWVDGKLLPICEPIPEEINWSKIIDDAKERIINKDSKTYPEWEIMQWLYQIDHIDILMKTNIHSEYFDSYYGLEEKFSCIFEIPDNVDDDYLEGASDYLAHFISNLNMWKGSHYKKDIKWVNKQYSTCLKARDHIWKIKAKKAGITFEEFVENKKELQKEMNKFFQEILNETK